TSLLNSQAAVLNAQTTKPADVSQVIDTDNQQVTDDLAAFFAPSMLKNGADQSDKSNKQKMDNISTTLKQAVNKQAVDSIQTTQANAKNAMISNVMPNLIHTQTIQDSLAISPSSEQLNFNTQMPLQHLENKHADTLIQLGSFINGHTVQYAANNPHLFTPDVSASQAGSKTLLQQDYQTKIELMPPSVDALMKESYDAKIKIYPPELGHVIAKLRIDKNSAELMILTENVRVKEIIEANLPELRQNFQNADINLTNVHVQSTLTDTKDQTGQYQRDSERSMDKENTNQQSNEALSPNESPKKSETIIDTYA
ncbi:MAG: flagellar hook-length control protein FliK, partial [Gammaproteobacteria bacterium]